MKTASLSVCHDGSDCLRPLQEACGKIFEASGAPSFALVAWSGAISGENLQESCQKVIPCPFLGVHAPAFYSSGGLSANGFSLWVAGGEDITATTLLLDELPGDSWICGEKAACRFLEQDARKGVFLHFPEALSYDASYFLHGFHGRTGPGFRHIGGMVSRKAAGGTCFFTENGTGETGGAIALIGGISLESDSTHGFSPIGSPMVLTHAEGTRILELDFLPAAERYRDIIRESTGEGVKDVALYPLGIPGHDGGLLVRDLERLNSDGSIECGSYIPDLSPISILTGNTAGILQGTKDLCQRVRQNRPRFALAFDCVTREAILKERFHEEIACLGKELDSLESFWGMISFGEICDVWGSPMYLNKTLGLGYGE